MNRNKNSLTSEILTLWSKETSGRVFCLRRGIAADSPVDGENTASLPELLRTHADWVDKHL